MIHRMTHVHQGHITSCDLEFDALAYAMAANAGVVKAICVVSFYRIDSDTASNDLEAVYRK